MCRSYLRLVLLSDLVVNRQSILRHALITRQQTSHKYRPGLSVVWNDCSPGCTV